MKGRTQRKKRMDTEEALHAYGDMVYRLALIPMIFTMCVALFVVHGDDPFAVKELAAIYLSVFVLMYISGPGNYALDRLIAERLRN